MLSTRDGFIAIRNFDNNFVEGKFHALVRIVNGEYDIEIRRDGGGGGGVDAEGRDGGGHNGNGGIFWSIDLMDNKTEEKAKKNEEQHRLDYAAYAGAFTRFVAGRGIISWTAVRYRLRGVWQLTRIGSLVFV